MARHRLARHRRNASLLLACLALPVLCRAGDPPPAGASPVPTPPEGPAATRCPRPARVFVCRRADATVHYRVEPTVARRMVGRLLCALTGKPTPGQAMGSLVGPTDRVGIKIATRGGPHLCTHRPVVDALADALRDAGVPPDHIVVWDRNEADLRAAAYLDPAAPRGYRVDWVRPGTGYDREAWFLAPVVGRLIWGDLLFAERKGDRPDPLSGRSHFPLVLTRGLTKIVNVMALSHSSGIGVGGAVANLTVAHVDNWRRFLTRPGAGDPALAEALLAPPLRGRVVLHLMDGLVAQYAGGPDFAAQYALGWGELAASLDPVALDERALRLIDEWRARANLEPVRPQTGYLDAAVALGLGSREGWEAVSVP